MSTSAAFSVEQPHLQPARNGMVAVQRWLWIVAALVVLMVAIGGATRLTGSGLSITEWKPVTGALLPLSHHSWMVEFEKYRATPQYQLLNHGMTLDEFQFIYLWEWGHRQLGRLIGIVYILPLLWFAVRGVVRGKLLVVLLILGAMGGAQGGIGWIMVASGLTPGMVAVAPIKLMLHLVAACIIYIGVVWVATDLRSRSRAGAQAQAAPARLRAAGSLIVVAILVQIALGALVAGLNAGMIFNTWPLMDGGFVPDIETLLPVSPWWHNLAESVALVQLNHRIGAYVLLALVLWHFFDVRKTMPGSKMARMAVVLVGLVLAQAVIGIVTLLLVVPLPAALLHQVMAVMVLGHAVAHRAMMR